MNLNRYTKGVAITGLTCLMFAGGAVAAPQQPSAAAIKAELDQMSKMQQQYQQELAQLQKLRQQYEDKLAELSQQQVKVATTEDTPTDTMSSKEYRTLKDAIDRIQLFGFFRAKYDHDDADPVGAGANNKHFYMDFEAKMRVSDEWEAHFQSETRKGYTVHQSWRGDSGSQDQDGTMQRVWVEGNPYNIGVELGTKWWGLGFQNVPFGHAADGVSLDYDFVPNWNAKAFWLRPRQSDLITMPNGYDTNIRGVNVTGSITENLATSITAATNKNNGDDQEMSAMGAFELQYKGIPDIVLTGVYSRTNAKTDNSSQEYKIEYKAIDLNDINSYMVYLRLFDFRALGDYSHDDEWGSLPRDTKGYILGVRYVPFQNVVWETFFSTQRRFRSNDWNSADTPHRAMRHLFRTQIDYHF